MMAVTVFLLGLMLLATTRMGEYARRQFYLQSVADNVAHSGATLMARQLNLSAVLNRALIGNQIAMAQWTGLASWLAMSIQVQQNVALITSPVPYLNTFMWTLARILGRFEHVFDQTVKGILILHAGLIKAISLVQVALESVMTVEIPLSLGDVVDAHDPKLEWDAFQGGGLMPFPSLWLRATNTRSTRNRRDSRLFKKLVLKSRDPFTKNRSYSWLRLPIVRIEKAGGNELETLANGVWNWNAIDSLAIHFSMVYKGFEPRIPLGWGARAAYRRNYGANGHHTVYGDAYSINKFVTDWAWASMKVYRVRSPAFNYLTIRDNSYGAHALLISITDPDTQQQAHARAEVRFSRPLAIFPRGDRHAEQSNLFNALWDAQLVPLSTVDKATLIAKAAWHES